MINLWEMYRDQQSGKPSPAWYRCDDMPKIAGLWVWECQDGLRRARGALMLTDEDLERGAPFHCDWVYGPLPERTNLETP